MKRFLILLGSILIVNNITAQTIEIENDSLIYEIIDYYRTIRFKAVIFPSVYDEIFPKLKVK